MANGRADHYRAAQAELEQQRTDYLNQINELDKLIAGIARQIQFVEGTPVASQSVDQSAITRSGSSSTVDPRAFKNMSVRWGVLKLFGERQPGISMSTSEIAKVLEAGGVESQGQRFVGNVSAVISTMKQKQEIEGVDDARYRLTDTGRQAWEHIKRSSKYLSRLTPSVS